MKSNTNKYILIISFLLFFLQTNIYAQMGIRDIYNIFTQNDSKLIGTNKIGVSYSGISAYGLTYQANIDDLFRLSITTFVSLDSYYSDNYVDYNYGFQLQKTIAGDNTSYAYIFAGGGLTNYNFTDIDNIYLRTEIASTYGLGLGGSVRFLSNFSLDLELGYGYCNTETIFLESNPFNPSNIYDPRIRIGTTFGVGIYYLF